MTTTNDNSKQQISRLLELGRIARQRHLDAGGSPHLSIGSLNDNDTLTQEERQEFLDLANQVFNDESIANLLKKNGTWQERSQAMKKILS